MDKAEKSALDLLFEPNPHTQLSLLCALVNKAVCRRCYEEKHQFNQLQITHMDFDIEGNLVVVLLCPKCYSMAKVVISNYIEDKHKITKFIGDYQYVDY